MQNFKSEDLTNFDRVDGEARNLASVGHAVNYPNTIIHPDTLHLLDDISSLDNLKGLCRISRVKKIICYTNGDYI